MKYVALETANCIVTGKPANVFSGHVLAKTFSKDNEKFATVSIIAGFVDSETHRSQKSDRFGCFGDWKPADGIQAGEHWGEWRQTAGIFPPV